MLNAGTCLEGELGLLTQGSLLPFLPQKQLTSSLGGTPDPASLSGGEDREQAGAHPGSRGFRKPSRKIKCWATGRVSDLNWKHICFFCFDEVLPFFAGL